MAAVAAQDDRRGPAPVDRQDRLLAGGRVETRDRRGQRPRQQPAVARPPAPRGGRRPRRPGGASGRPVGQDDAPVAARRARPDALDRRRRADPRTTAAPASRPSSMRDVAGLEARRPVALVRRVVLLVDDDRGRHRRAARGPPAASRRRCRRRRARIRRHSSARSPSPRPEWTSATRASRSARRRSTSGIASAISGHEHERGPAALERRDDRLDVDRGLAAAGHAVEEERRRIAGRDRRADRGHGLGLGAAAGRSPAGRPPRSPTGRPASGRRGRSRTSTSTRPRRTSPAQRADARGAPARSAPATPAVGRPRRSSSVSGGRPGAGRAARPGGPLAGAAASPAVSRPAVASGGSSARSAARRRRRAASSRA